PLFSFPNPFPAGAGNIPSQSISGFPIDAKNGRIHQFNVTLEHQIGQMGLRASYSGMRARGLNYDLNLNKPAPSNIPFTQLRRPYPQFVSTTYGQANGEINYNAFTLEAQQKIGALTFDAHWTWAHNMLNYLNLENPYSPNLWNRDSVVANQRFVASTYWNIPMGRGRRYLNSASRFVNGVLGDWQMAFILVFQTGNF